MSKIQAPPPKHASTPKSMPESIPPQTPPRPSFSARLTPPSSPGHKLDGFTAAQPFGPGVIDLYNSTKDCLEETGVVDRFLDGSNALLNILDEVQKIHPFVGVAVIAFKAILKLDMTRRQNNGRIIALHMEMKDMMVVLVGLREVPKFKNANEVLDKLLCDTAEDIKRCANACDTYTRKNLLVKTLKSSSWEGQFLDFIKLFTERRCAFQSQINIIAVVGVGVVGEKVFDLNKKLSEKLDEMQTMLQKLVSPEEKELTLLIERHGGISACQKGDKLKELHDERINAHPTIDAPEREAGSILDFEKLKYDLSIDLQQAMDENMKMFSGKFELKKRLVVEMSRAMERESDRVIRSVTSGPHEKIKNDDMRELWRVMRWRGSVKSRRFTMALRDYFHESWRFDEVPVTTENPKENREPKAAATPVVANRNYAPWALDYIRVTLIQPISEAFDDDGTGFVTVTEVNTFTTSRPISWSLEHWIAYWAIGWHQSLWEYRLKIRELFAKMFAILPDILPANRAYVNKYIDDVYQPVTTLESAVNHCFINKLVQNKFKEYVQLEEKRLAKNLQDVRYDIDEMDTVALVSGPGRIEKFILPLLYLILKRHFDLFRICRIRNTHANELPDAANTIKYVVKVFNVRFGTLHSIFGHQRLDLKQYFDAFAHGLFKYHYEPSSLWSHARVRERSFPDYTYNDHLETEINASDIRTILINPVGRSELDFTGYLPQPRTETVAPSSTGKALLGLWNGFTYGVASAEEPNAGMISMTLCAAAEHSRAFSASGRCDLGAFSITGEYSQTGKAITVVFKREVSGRVRYWRGRLDTASGESIEGTITGTWGSKPDPATHRGVFVLKRVPPEDLRFRPAPAAFHTDKVDALWKFAISATRDKVRRKLWPMSYFLERQKTKRRFIELYKRRMRFNCSVRVGDREDKEYTHIRKTFTLSDSLLYHSQAEFEVERVHGYLVYCENCEDKIYGARIICLECEAKHTWCPVNLCEAEECATASVDRDDLTGPHVPTHNVIKVRRVVHLSKWGDLERMANDALKRANAALGGTESVARREYDSDDSSQDFYASPKLGSKQRGSTGRKDIGDDCKEEGEEAGIKCAACEKGVTQPCWYCAQCKDDTFICIKCDNKGLKGFKRGHRSTHDLVKCQKARKGGTASIEDRFTNLEERLGEFERRVGKALRDILHEIRGGAEPEDDEEAIDS